MISFLKPKKAHLSEFCFYCRMSRHVLLSRLAEHFQAASPPGQRFPSPERSVSPRSPTSGNSPPHSPDSFSQKRLDVLQLGDIEIAGRALKQYARATGKSLSSALIFFPMCGKAKRSMSCITTYCSYYAITKICSTSK